MSVIATGNVQYFIYGDYYFVGNNATKTPDGITSTSFPGEIIIKEQINNNNKKKSLKSLKMLSQNAKELQK